MTLPCSGLGRDLECQEGYGVVVPCVANQVFSRIRVIVLLDGLMVEHGKSIRDSIGETERFKELEQRTAHRGATLTGLGDRIHLASSDVDLETHVASCDVRQL